MQAHTFTEQPSVDGRGGEDLRSYLAPVWRRRWLVLALVVAVTAGTYLFYDSKPHIYATATEVLVGSDNDELVLGSPVYTTSRALQNQVRLAQTTTVAEQVGKDLGFRGDPRVLLGAISVSASSDADILVFSSSAASPETAAAIANGFAKAFIEVQAKERRDDAQKSLRKAERQLAGLIASGEHPRGGVARSLRDRIRRLKTALTLPAGSARQIDPAPVSARPISPKPKQNAIFAFVLSLMFGILAAFGLERMDRRIRNLDDVGRAFDMEVLGIVPHSRDVTPTVNGRPALPETHREMFRTIRTSLGLASPHRPLRKLVVTSAVPLEGKSSFVRNLALVYREAGMKVAVIEADLRRPTLARLFNVQTDVGVTEALAGSADPVEALHAVDTAVEPGAVVTALRAPTETAHGYGASNGNGNGNGNGHGDAFPAGGLQLIAAGARPSNPPELLAAQQFKAFVDHLAASHDVVIIDTPPLLAVSDAVPLIEDADGTVIVTRVGRSTYSEARRVSDLLARIPGARVLGVIANDAPDALVGTRYDYY
jgi:Mrp family chromosome partitioning ATPase/capsular polysaccharide biosynthesis protein